MAGFFSSDRYTKPGKGVDEANAYGKPGFVLFFKVFGRKLSSFLGLNLLMFLCSIPFLILAYFFIAGNLFGQQVMEYFQIGQGDPAVLFVRFAIACACVFIPVVSFGPAYTGVYYVLRQFSREKHAYVWWDFRDILVSYLKKGTIICLINMIVFFVMTYAFYMYINYFAPSIAADMTSVVSWVNYVAIGLLGFMLIVFMLVSMYVYPILCTYDLSVGKTYRLAYMYALMKLPQNILILLLDFVILVLVYLVMPYSYYWISLILTLLVLPVFIAYINTFCVDAMMRKLDPNVEAQANNRVDQDPE